MQSCRNLKKIHKSRISQICLVNRIFHNLPKTACLTPNIHECDNNGAVSNDQSELSSSSHRLKNVHQNWEDLALTTVLVLIFNITIHILPPLYHVRKLTIPIISWAHW